MLAHQHSTANWVLYCSEDMCLSVCLSLALWERLDTSSITRLDRFCFRGIKLQDLLYSFPVCKPPICDVSANEFTRTLYTWSLIYLLINIGLLYLWFHEICWNLWQTTVWMVMSVVIIAPVVVSSPGSRGDCRNSASGRRPYDQANRPEPEARL